MDLRPHIGKGMWALLDKSLTGVYGLAVLFLLIGKLPRAEYGSYALAFTIVNIGLLFNKGFILFPMTKFEAEEVARPRLLGNAFLLSLFSMLMFGLVIFVLAPYLGELFHTQNVAALLKWTPLVLMGFFFRDFSISFLQAHRRLKLMVMLDAIYFLGVAGGFAALNFMGIFNRAILAVWTHLACAWICSLVAFFPMLKYLKMDLKFNKEDIKKVAGYGRYSLSMSVGEISFYQLDLIFLGKFFNPSVVAVYNAAKLLFRFYTLLTQSINLLIFPAVSNLQAHQRLSEVKILFEKIVAYYLSLMLILNIILFLGADIVLNFIFAGKYPDSVPIFRIFLLISFFEPLYNLSTGVLYGLGKPEKAFRPLIIAVPLFILLNLGLIPIFQGIGAAIVFGIINVYMAVRLLNSLNKEAGISLGNSFRYTLKFPQLAKDFLSGLK